VAVETSTEIAAGDALRINYGEIGNEQVYWYLLIVGLFCLFSRPLLPL
jgi:hypothetical protein